MSALLSTLVGGAQANRTVNAVGDIRTVSTLPHYDLNMLVTACSSPGTIVNPGNSPGSSSILRQLIDMSGLPYGISREVANDGEPYAHQGGNAIDVVASSVAPDEHTSLAAICTLLRTVPQLFAVVIHRDPDHSDEDLYIWDGQLTNADRFGGTSSDQVVEAVGRIHIASSNGRLAAALSQPETRATLTPGGTSSLPGDPFSDREVEVAYGVTVPVAGLAVGIDETQLTPTRFW